MKTYIARSHLRTFYSIGGGSGTPLQGQLIQFNLPSLSKESIFSPVLHISLWE